MNQEELKDNPKFKKNKRINAKGIIRGVFSLTSLNYIILVLDSLVIFYASSFQIDLENMGIYNSLMQFVPIITLFAVFGFKNTSNKFLTMYDSKNERNKSAAVVYFMTIFNCTASILFSFLFLLLPSFFSNLLLDSPEYANYVQLLGINMIFIPIAVFNQFFILRYRFKTYMIGNLIGNSIRIVSIIILLNITHDISAYFYSTMIGQGIIFIFFLIQILRTFKKPDFSISIKEIIKFTIPVFISQIFVYLKQYVYNLFFLLYFQNLVQMGLLYFIKKFFNIILVSFNSLHSLLVVYYASILYGDEPERRYKDLTFQISKFYQIFAFIIGFGFMIIAPFFIKLITTIYYSVEDVFTVGTITMILFGFYFIFNLFYYIPPTLVNLYEHSRKILLIHFKSIIVYLVSYFFLIKYLGMIGIPIGQTIGYLSFIYLNYKEISKKHEIGFDKKSLIKVLISFLPFMLIIPFLYFFAKNDQNLIEVNLKFMILLFPINTFLLTVILGLTAILVLIILIRNFRVFTEIDKNVLTQMFGIKLAKFFSKILIKELKPEKISR